MAVRGRPFQKGGDPRQGRGRSPGLATLIRAETQDGKELVEFALKTLREAEAARDKQWACDYLTERGWGKAVEVTVKEAEDNPLGQLSVEELKALAKGTQ